MPVISAGPLSIAAAEAFRVSVISTRQVSHRYVITSSLVPDGKLMEAAPLAAIAEPHTGHGWLNRNECILFGSVRPDNFPNRRADQQHSRAFRINGKYPLPIFCPSHKPMPRQRIFGGALT